MTMITRAYFLLGAVLVVAFLITVGPYLAGQTINIWMAFGAGLALIAYGRSNIRRQWVSIGAIEPQFYALLRDKTGIAADPDFDPQMDKAQWPKLRGKLRALFMTKTRDDWNAIMEGTDICYAPVLDLDEAPQHPHNLARKTFVEVDGEIQPAPAPRFSRTVPEVERGAPAIGGDTDTVLMESGLSQAEINELRATGAVA